MHLLWYYTAMHLYSTQSVSPPPMIRVIHFCTCVLIIYLLISIIYVLNKKKSISREKSPLKDHLRKMNFPCNIFVEKMSIMKKLY